MNKVVLVTGGAKGIGASIVRTLASSSYDIIINYNTSSKEANELKEEVLKFNVKCITIKADISKEEEIDYMFDIIQKEFNRVDILINNAGVDYSNIFDKKTAEVFRKTLDVNLIGAFLVSKKASQYMMNNKWGRIINISSTNSINTYYPMCLEYDASKAALNSLTHNLAIEFSPYVTVNAIAPGFIGTEAELDGYDEEFMKLEKEKILLRRFGEPEEVAKLVRFLISDDASYINNSIIRIDGGQYGSN